jgi:hypothetical protein
VLDFIYAVVCAASPTIVLVPMTILYACAAAFLHFRLYNQALKPNLLEMIVLFCVVAFLHFSAAYFYYLNFSWFWTHKAVSAPVSAPQPNHELLRHFKHA